MTDSEALRVIVAVAILVPVVVRLLVWWVDRRLPSRQTTATNSQPLPPEGRRIVAGATLPGVIGAFVLGVFGMDHIWAGVALAALTGAYLWFGLNWLWHHSQRRAGDDPRP